jgi:hypothetical protein
VKFGKEINLELMYKLCMKLFIRLEIQTGQRHENFKFDLVRMSISGYCTHKRNTEWYNCYAFFA